MKISKGFSLIEIMVAVAIIAILAAIGLPMYSQHQIKVNRTDVQAELMQIAGELQRYKLIKHSYKDASLENLHFSQSFPATGNSKYNLSLELVANNQEYFLSATPVEKSQQDGDGIVCLNQDGQKAWSKSYKVKKDCTDALSSTSTWNQ